MKLAADECCDALLVSGLRSDGHDVMYIKETASGADDDGVLQTAALEQRVLITEDKDFGELVVRLRKPAHGIILIRMNPTDSQAKLDRLREIFLTESNRLVGYFVVVDQNKMRFRPLPSP